MGGMRPINRGTFTIVRQVNVNVVDKVTVNEETLQKIAELLGIPEAERDRLITGTVWIGAPPTTPGDGPSSSPPSGRARPSSTRRRRRQSE
jgi:hypothetical protein